MGRLGKIMYCIIKVFGNNDRSRAWGVSLTLRRDTTTHSWEIISYFCDSDYHVMSCFLSSTSSILNFSSWYHLYSIPFLVESFTFFSPLNYFVTNSHHTIKSALKNSKNTILRILFFILVYFRFSLSFVVQI